MVGNVEIEFPDYLTGYNVEPTPVTYQEVFTHLTPKTGGLVDVACLGAVGNGYVTWPAAIGELGSLDSICELPPPRPSPPGKTPTAP